MNKQVILLTDAETAPAMELFESLNSAGISVLSYDLNATRAMDEVCPESWSHPLAVLYEIPTQANSKHLSLVVSQARSVWPGTSIVACRRQPATPLAGFRPDNQALKRLGFRAVADSPPQLPALLRQVEDVVGTGELKLPEGFKPIPDSRAFTLPNSIRSQHLRGAFALLGLASSRIGSEGSRSGRARRSRPIGPC